jgi:tetratricopeptide (TPR) repeat protein
LLLLPALLVMLGSWFVVRWYVGNTVAEYAPTVDQGGIEMARLAVRWAPDDPLTHWRLGSLEEKVFSADNLVAAVHEYQRAVDLSPNDYRYWMELGRALEAGGDRESGEKALRRAVDLAPAYSQPRWRFGNLLLREGKTEEAFDQLGHAAEGDNLLRQQIFDLAMRVFDGNVKEIARIACVSAAARLQFALYLISVGRYDDAIGMWNTISRADRASQSALCKELKKNLIDQKHFHAALEVMRGIDPEETWPQLEQFWNGGFESSITGSVVCGPVATSNGAWSAYSQAGSSSIPWTLTLPACRP